MSFADLRSYLRRLEADGDLVRVQAEVDPNQDVTIIQHKVLAAGGPALLFERVTGSPYRMVTNLFGTRRRVELAFGGPPQRIGELIAGAAESLMPPTLRGLWSSRNRIRRLMAGRLQTVRRGPVLQECADPPRLDRLPVLTCWPDDGGPFFTLPLVHTTDPESGTGNLGIYRLQRFSDAATGMHWQIAKGGGFHFAKAARLGQPLPVSVFMGGPPALTLAAVAPLPEGIDERLVAALMMGKPLKVIRRETTGHRIPATAEFVLEGSVTAGDVRQEGPFGDHLGHYSHSAEFPVFRVDRVLARRDAIYPATVVGKPPQEDYYIGEALQEMTLPLLRMIKPAIADLWAYPQTGFHPLSVAAVRQRYAHEALTTALAILGEGQLALTKVLIVVDHDVDVRSFADVSEALWKWFDHEQGLHLLAPTAQDTLDFTGPAMNTGSRLIMIATENGKPPRRTNPPADPPPAGDVHNAIAAMTRLGPAVLVAQVRDGADTESVGRAIAAHRVTGEYLLHVLVSADVPIDDPAMILWGWFTRFDPLTDVHPAKRIAAGNRTLLQPPLMIDATWKSGYRKPVALDPQRAAAVDADWDRYGIDLEGGAHG